MEARKTASAIKVRYGKVILSGSCASGKTSFFRLIMKKKFEDQYKSTGLADAHRVIFTTKAYIQPSTSGENVEFEVLDFDCEITQLRSYVHTKVNNAASLSTVPDTAHEPTESAVEATTTSQSITEIETVIADNSETEQIPKEATKNNESKEKIWDILTFVDTGGQPEYISMLPAVNNSVMLTFVVHKMEGGVRSLDNPVTVTHSGDHCFKPYSLGYSNLDLIKTLISFTNNIFLHKKPFLDEVCCKEGSSASYLSFIGTHSDKITENDVNEIDKVLARTVADSELENVLAKVNPKYQHLIPVNNTTAGETGEDKNASKIRRKIYHLLENQPIYEVPYVWLLLELEIRKACEDRGSCFITYTEVLKLCKQKGLMNDNEDFIRNGLKFHHLFGVLLYFDEVEGIRDLIITDHKWLLNKLTDIVLHFYYTDLTSKCLNDFKQGIFNKSLIDQMNLATEFKKSGIDVETFDVKESFINLLQHLKIIAPIENSTKYFMPCLLNNCNFAEKEQKILQSYGTNCVVTDDNPNLPIEPLLIQFTLCSSSDQVGSFPRGVFCCLIVQLLQDNQEWRLQWSPNVKKVFSNLVTFYISYESSGHYITLIDRLFFLEIQVAHKYKLPYGSTIYHRISCVIGEALRKVGRSLNFHGFNLSYGFLCHECRNPEVHMTKLLKKDSMSLFCYCNQPTEMTLSHQVWFDVSTISEEVSICGPRRKPEAIYAKEGITTYICILMYTLYIATSAYLCII